MPLDMARTNARTQMMIGAILDELLWMLDETQIAYFCNDRAHRFPTDIRKDADFEKAREIIHNMIYREANKNDDRIFGGEAEHLHFR